MRIGDLARQAQVSVETIRFYQNKGLLPIPEKPAGGFRDYDQSILDQLLLIKRAKRLGFTLDEILSVIQKLPDDDSCVHTRAIIRAKLDSIHQQMHELGDLEQLLRKLADGCTPECDNESEDCQILQYLHGEDQAS